MSEISWIDSPGAIRQGEQLDMALLKVYLHKHYDGFRGHLEAKQFPGGASNLTYALTIDDKQYILRRPPFGSKVKSAHDMSREYKILSRIRREYDKAPRPVLYCDDHQYMGAEFYIMERVEGIILRSTSPKEMFPSPDKMRAIAESLIANQVALHNVDVAAAGLGDLGHPEGYVRRQVEGWSKRYQKSKTHDLKIVDQVGRWLNDHIKTEIAHTIIHNDYKYDNVVLDPEDWTKILAVLDWEMTTQGCPLMDLGTTLSYWTDPADGPMFSKMKLSPTTYPGNPTRVEVVELYEKFSGQTVDDVVFYFAFGLFKTAVVVQQLYYRYHHGMTKDERFKEMQPAVEGLCYLAWQAIQKNRLDDLFK